MNNINRQQTSPLKWPKSRRGLNIEVGTSLPVGKVVPVFATHLLRQDSLKANLEFNIEMMETNELIANHVVARVSAYVVPDLALERFEKSRDQFDRSYMGQPQINGGSVVPFYDYEEMGAPGADPIYQYLGLHAPEHTVENPSYVETGYAEAYNLIHNFRLRNRSTDLYEEVKRDRTDKTLAQAFWDLGRFQNVLPSFDQSIMEGEVPLNLIDAKLPVSGIAKHNDDFAQGSLTLRETGGTETYPTSSIMDGGGLNTRFYVREDADNPGFPDIYAEMQQNDITISLASIEQARRLQSFAKIRRQFDGLSDDEADEYIIDMMMSGLRIPDLSLTQPILLKQQTVQFSQGKRHATDSGNLDDSAVSGFAGGRMTIRVPELEVGGIVMVVVEAFPQQLFERQSDPRFNNYHSVQSVPAGKPQTFHLPEALRDFNDPQKVDVVHNREIDTGHTEGGDNFGYGPLNWKWGVFGPRLGGKFHADLAADADRQRFWAAETQDPVLGKDFYLVPSDLQTDVFIREGDPFEFFMAGPAGISGQTQFGKLLIEDTGNYEKLEAQMDNDRIEQESE